jgi:Mn2+/Fe2+ NRAMP family transporter
MPALSQEQWAGTIAFVNVLILLWGRYSLLERASLFMVISFSIITLIGAVALQFSANAAPLEEVLAGLRVQIAPLMATAAIGMAVSSFAGTGVSAGELLGYTYWCVEKGYARYAGEADGTEEWTRRAKGWVRVMQIDVWLATVIFTTTTLAFFWLGAGVLHRQGMRPTDSQMILTLQTIYTGSLGPWAAGLFLVGGFFVLYSTIFSGTAGASRMWADMLGVMGVVKFEDFRNRMKWIRIFTVLVPLIQTSTFLMHRSPQSALILSSIFVGMQIPIIAGVAIWLRYKRTDPSIRPTAWTDALLWTCTLIIATVSSVYLVVKGPDLLKLVGGN